MSENENRLNEILLSSRRVLVTTHVRPDGDALGAVAAMVRGLKGKGIEADVLLLSHLPRKYAFIFEDAALHYREFENTWPADLSLDAYDALLVVDTGTWSQLPGLRERFEHWDKPRLVIDHHLTQEEWADVKLIDTSVGACCEIIAELIEDWGIALDGATAQALFVGIVSDTGWFMYSNTRPVTLRTAARLLESGVDIDRVYQLLYQSERPQRVALHARGLASLELFDEGRVAVMQIRRSDFTETGANVNDTENLINFPMQIRTVQVSILLTEPPEISPRQSPQIRASFRSKGQVDVAKFAQQFGGGGHARAAGAKFDGATLERAHERILAAVRAMW